MSDPVQSLLAPIFQANRQAAPNFLARQNVVACGVGYKVKGQQLTNTPSVVVSVTRKLPSGQIHPDDLIPPAIQNVPTDVIETGEILAFGIDRTVALRPVRPGISVGNLNGATGTVGCIVRRGNQRFILSNNHVLAMLNQANPGASIVQPGTADGGTSANQIATLAQFTPIIFGQDAAATADTPASAAQSTQPQGCAALIAQLLNTLTALRTPTTAQPAPPLVAPTNQVDAAIAAPLRDDLVDPNIVDIGAPPQGVAEPALGMQVFKSGRTSGVTEGIITQVDVVAIVKYDDTHSARFTNQFMITPCSQPGDSGSLILDFQRNAVGLLFSGSNLITVASPISAVLAALNVELVTAAPPAPELG